MYAMYLIDMWLIGYWLLIPQHWVATISCIFSTRTSYTIAKSYTEKNCVETIMHLLLGIYKKSLPYKKCVRLSVL